MFVLCNVFDILENGACCFELCVLFVAYIHIPADEVIALKYVVCMTSNHFLELCMARYLPPSIISNWVIWSWSSVARYNRLNGEDKQQKCKISITKTSWKFTTENTKRFSSFFSRWDIWLQVYSASIENKYDVM